MASLALIDNVLDIVEDDYNDHEEVEDEEEDNVVDYYNMERIITDCVTQSDLSLVWDVMSCHSVYLSSFLRTHHILLHSNTAPLPKKSLSPMIKELQTLFSSHVSVDSDQQSSSPERRPRPHTRLLTN